MSDYIVNKKKVVISRYMDICMYIHMYVCINVCLSVCLCMYV